MPGVVQMKKAFFDKEKVLRAMDRATWQVLSKAGSFIMTTARSSMRKRKKPAEPGKPPSVHEGSLKRLLFFAFDSRTKSVVVGPATFGKGQAPHVQEFGGEALVIARSRRTGRRVYRNGKPLVVKAKIRPHPFMAPALAKELPNIPPLFRARLKGD